MSSRSQSTLTSAAWPQQQSDAAPSGLRKGQAAGAPGSHPELRGAFGSRDSPDSGAAPAAASRPDIPGTTRARPPLWTPINRFPAAEALGSCSPNLPLSQASCEAALRRSNYSSRHARRRGGARLWRREAVRWRQVCNRKRRLWQSELGAVAAAA